MYASERLGELQVPCFNDDKLRITAIPPRKQPCVDSGNVPFRIRLSDAHGLKTHLRNCVKKQGDDRALAENDFERRWRSFVTELENADKEARLRQLSLQASLGIDQCNGNLPKLKAPRPIWIPVLELWLSPAKALIFEKYWGKLILGHRIFSSDPAPHIPRCTHYKLKGLTQEKRDELMRKNALDAQTRLKRLRDNCRMQELREIEEINSKLAAFKQSVRNWRARGQSEHREAGQSNNQPQRERLPNRPHKDKNVTRGFHKKEEGPFSRSHHAGTPTNSIDGLQSPSNIDNDQFKGHVNMGADKLNEEAQLPENLDEGASSIGEDNPRELTPVELPDWVRDFVDKKRKAQIDLDAARQMPQEGMPVPVWVECVDENGNVIITPAQVSEAPHGEARCLDNTASLMERQAPRPVGMESREIPNGLITASSEQGPYHRAHQARLNNRSRGKDIGAWCPKNHDNTQWLQIDMGTQRNVQQIATQGMPQSSVRRPKDRRWVESFVLSFSDDGLRWRYYKDQNNNPKIFIGNSDLYNTAKNSFIEGIKTRYLRIHPTSWNTGIALRVEIYVERESKEKNDATDDVSVSEDVVPCHNSERASTCSESNFSEEESDSASEYIFHDDLTDEENNIDAGEEEHSSSNFLRVTAESAANIGRFSEASRLQSVASGGVCTPMSRESKQLPPVQAKSTEEGSGSSLENASESCKPATGPKRRFEELQNQHKAGEKKRVTFRSIVGRLMSIPDVSTGITLDANEERDDFLSKYCILKESQKILFARVFQKLDDDDDGLIKKDQLMGGLAALNLNSIRDAEMAYIMELIDVFEEKIEGGIDQKTFNIIAAFADRLKRVDSFTRGIIGDTSFANLYLHAHKTRDLFEKMLDKGETTISGEQFLIELEAGGIKTESQRLVRTYTDQKKHLDFLDFAIYFPLFLHTHEQIMSTPL